MQDNFADVRPVTRSYFSEDSFVDVDSSAEDPPFPENTNLLIRAVGRTIGLDHAEHSDVRNSWVSDLSDLSGGKRTRGIAS